MSLESLGITQHEYDRARAAVQADIDATRIKPISMEAFKKTDEEREEVMNAKLRWRASMRLAGLSKRSGIINPHTAR